MSFPNATRIELPILQELVAIGGAEDVRFLYQRLVAYFPQLESEDAFAEVAGGVRVDRATRWKLFVRRAGRVLDEKREIERDLRGRWAITERGRRRVADEETRFSLAEPDASIEGAARKTEPLTHVGAQQMLLDIGRALGHYAQSEFEYYDVIWRASAKSPRLTHVFEVQRKGSVDAALVKLKRAYEAQRSKPFLIVASERDTNRARRELSLDQLGAFHEIERVTTIISFEQLSHLHRALIPVKDLLAEFLD